MDLMKDLFKAAWSVASPTQKEGIIRYAEENSLSEYLPKKARVEIKKAYNPVSGQGIIVKSWEADDKVFVEGWISTPRMDLEKDITEPESFSPAIAGYFARRAPLSIEHEAKYLPIGHLQKAAIVRDGSVLSSAVHPTDPAEFEHFPGFGSGVWVRAVANAEPGMSALRKGNVGGFSFIGNATHMEQIPGGRYRYTHLDPWIESTIAAYPVNPDAVISVVKAFGITPQEEENTMNLDELLKLAAEKTESDRKASETPVVTKAVTVEDLASMIGELTTAMDAKITKAMEAVAPARLEGAGRQGTVEPKESPIEADPAAYIVQKSLRNEALDMTDKQLVWGLTYNALTFGMKD